MLSRPRRVRRLDWGVSACPLNKPYDLSFAQLTAYDSVWVRAEDEDGHIGLGEAVPLPGYNWETLETVSSTVAALVAGAERESAAAIVERCRAVRADHPFAASAVMTALDLPLFLDRTASDRRFPLSAAIAGEWPLDQLRRTAEAHLDAGYGFLKCKVGRDLEGDVAAARCLLNEWPGRPFGVVFDANQAYAPDAALAFARALRACASDRLQWLEQPVDRRDWDGMERLCRRGEVAIVVDESIYDEADVARAAAIGAHGVKLKLVKNFGIAETLSLARRARELGLTVVFGNGVATDLGNLGEYLVLASAPELFAAPAECSGFAKLREPLLGSLLRIDDKGRLTASAGADEIAACLAGFSAHARGVTQPSIGVSR
jgi:L-alanine-DL-glutamate epimerase-like enolase superfamily enzyme